jgi:hypothetical protein
MQGLREEKWCRGVGVLAGWAAKLHAAVIRRGVGDGTITRLLASALRADRNSGVRASGRPSLQDVLRPSLLMSLFHDVLGEVTSLEQR